MSSTPSTPATTGPVTSTPASTTLASTGPRTPAAAVADDLLAADTSMGAVTLHVGDLPAMVAYYRDAIALEVVAEDAGATTLGRGARPLVVLRHTPGLPVPARGQAGLFHTAILFEDRAALAASVASLARTAPRSYTGSADHLVSEAFYATDPEGNGVELYTDRPRETWTWDDGVLRMASLALDPNRFLQEHLTGAGGERPHDAPAVVGHVHLQVGDTAAAKAFYVDVLGFEVTTSLGSSALFVSAGGYHHHMAMNTWNSAGAGPRAAALGLGEVAITVPGTDDLAALADRLRHHAVPATHDGRTLAFQDPWGSRLLVSAAA